MPVAPQAKKHVIGDYAAQVGETLITRCPIWCPFDFGFYAIQCRSVRDQTPQEYSENKVVRLLLRSHADQCKMGKITFRVGCIKPGSANSPRSPILSQDFDFAAFAAAGPFVDLS